jgi:hypothetical protein
MAGLGGVPSGRILRFIIFKPGRRIIRSRRFQVDFWSAVVERGIGCASPDGEFGLWKCIIRSRHCGGALEVDAQGIYIVPPRVELDSPPISANKGCGGTNGFGAIGVFGCTSNTLERPRQASLLCGNILGVSEFSEEVVFPVSVYLWSVTGSFH